MALRTHLWIIALASLILCGAAGAFAADLPDLTPDITDWKVVLDTTVSTGDVAEGCAESTSGIDLLRFTVHMENVGAADLVLGNPLCPEPCSDHPLAVCDNPAFMCSPAEGHNHAHFIGFSRYDLLDDTGQTVLVGHKQGYCVRDSICARPKYNCTNQGITAGCSDSYDASLGCQYLDITDVPGGTYTLQVTVDPLDEITESNKDNNVMTLSVTIPDRAGVTPRATATAPPETPSPPDTTPTPTPTHLPPPTAEPATSTPVSEPVVTCVGDCDGDGTVSLDEILVMTNIVLGTDELPGCIAGDPGGDGRISIDELLVGVRNAVSGCPAS